MASTRNIHQFSVPHASNDLAPRLDITGRHESKRQGKKKCTKIPNKSYPYPYPNKLKPNPNEHLLAQRTPLPKTHPVEMGLVIVQTPMVRIREEFLPRGLVML